MMPPMQSDQLNENTATAKRVEDLTVEGDLTITEWSDGAKTFRCQRSAWKKSEHGTIIITLELPQLLRE